VQFPKNFLWGAATASHQVEGNNRWNDWWEFEQDGRVPHRSGDACRHFELYDEDFRLAQSLGHNAHRFSIEWSRIEPIEGQWNHEALDHYAEVLTALKARGLEPIVTLHHFTNPAWFLQRGGWTRPDAVSIFERYVEFVAARLASRAKYWLTINEPTVYIKLAFVTGVWPPCEKGSWRHAYLALRNQCRAHTAAYDILHRHRADVMVGFSHSAPYIVPCNPHRLRDRWAAQLRDWVLNRLCFRLLGRPPRRALDFIGVNYYARQIVRSGWKGMELLFGADCTEAHHGDARNFNSLGWEVHPAGLTGILRRLSRYRVPLMVTENGISTTDEAQRTEFIRSHIRALAAALQEGIDVRGYLYWTLFDNFEWAAGYTAHFGLAAVDRVTQRRVLRPAAQIYAAVCFANSDCLSDDDSTMVTGGAPLQDT
jgi:beta-glucosidase